MEEFLNPDLYTDISEKKIELILEKLSEEGLRCPLANQGMLGLGAGSALAEEAIAKHYAVPWERIVLVDHDYALGSIRRDAGLVTVGGDIFQVMDSYNGSPFGLVTALGIEYVLEKTVNWIHFWSGLQKVTTSGSLVLIGPRMDDKEIPRMFQEIDFSGFKSLSVFRRE